MSYEIEIKSLAPQKIVTYTEEKQMHQLQSAAIKLYKEIDCQNSGSFTCLSQEFQLSLKSKMQVCWPVTNAYLNINPDTTKYVVLPRCQVVSASFFGDYSQTSKVLGALMSYAEKEGIELEPPLRILYHSADPLPKDDSFLNLMKKLIKPTQIHTELQIPIVGSTPYEL